MGYRLQSKKSPGLIYLSVLSASGSLEYLVRMDFEWLNAVKHRGCASKHIQSEVLNWRKPRWDTKLPIE